MTHPIKFLYLGNHAGIFLTHRLPVMLRLQEAGYEIHVAVPEKEDTIQKLAVDHARSAIEQRGFVFHPVPFERKSTNPLIELKTLFSILRLYRHLQPDLVYHATVKPVIYGGIVSRLARVPAVINSITGLGYLFSSTDTKARLIQAAAKPAYRLALAHPNACALFQNHDDHQTFIDLKLVKPDKAVVIKGSGVDMQVFQHLPEPAGIPQVVLPSRMLWSKGVGEFVEAARQLRKEKITARFILVGDSDPDNPETIPQEQLQAWNDSGIVEWWGWRKDMAAVLQKASLVCLPSYREGVPKSLIEAAASGRAIVTTDAPGCREIVRHYENGLLVPVKNAPALAEAIRTLIQDPELRRRMGIRSREIAEAEFSSTLVAEKILVICQQLLIAVGA